MSPIASLKMMASPVAVALVLMTATHVWAVSDWVSMNPDGNGNWSEAGNWSPAVVPNNDGGNLYDVTIRQPDPNINFAGPTLDVTVAIESLSLFDSAAVRTDPSNSERLTVNGVTSLATTPGNGGAYGLLEVNNGSVFTLHELANLNNGTLTGNYTVISDTIGSVLQFDNADVRINQAYITLSGASADFRDNNGLQALRNLNTNSGALLLENGRVVDLNGGLTNSGFLQLDSTAALPASALSVNGNLTNTPGALLRVNGQLFVGAVLINQGAQGPGMSGGEVDFFGTGSAGHGTFETYGSTGSSAGQALTTFTDTATAANGTFFTYGGTSRGSTGLSDHASAGNAKFFVYGSTVSGSFGGVLGFDGNATGESATITIQGGSVAGTGTGAMLDFRGDSTAGNATLIAHGGTNGGEGGLIRFFNNSSGGTARVQLDGNSELDLNNYAGPAFVLGSLEGSGGIVRLYDVPLTVGGNNLSTTFAGRIESFQNSTTASLTKIGSGTFTLTGANTFANTYGGGTFVNGGTLLAQTTSDSATGPGAVTVNNAGSVLGGSGFVDGAVVVNQAAALRGGEGTAVEGALTLRGNVTLNDGSIIELALGAAGTHSSLVRSGNSNWSFDVDQAFRFLDFGAEPGTYNNLITGLAGNPVDPSLWTITNAGWIGTFSFDGNNIDLDLIAVPEPAGWMCALLAASLIAWKQQRQSIIKGSSRLARGPRMKLISRRET